MSCKLCHCAAFKAKSQYLNKKTGATEPNLDKTSNFQKIVGNVSIVSYLKLSPRISSDFFLCKIYKECNENPELVISEGG